MNYAQRPHPVPTSSASVASASLVTLGIFDLSRCPVTNPNLPATNQWHTLPNTGAAMPTTLTPDQMKHRVRTHFEDFVNNRKAEVIRTNMTPDFRDHDGPGGQPTGVEGDEQMMIAMYQRMPDLHLTIEDMIADGDKVVCRNVWRWTDPASGKKMSFQGFVLWRFEGDRIAERWATVTPPSETSSWAR